MIRTSRLAKRYGRTQALADLTLEIARGECLGLAGPNGCGRTTLLRIIATLVPPTSGTVQVDGLDVVRDVYRVRARVAYVGEERLRGEGLRVGEYLEFVKSVRRDGANPLASAVGEALARAELDGSASVETLSAGLRQRLTLAAALLPAPDVLLLDDPFRALDAGARLRFMNWLGEARARGAAIVVATNTDSDLQALCDRVARLETGRLVEVLRRSARPETETRAPTMAAAEA